MDSQSWRARHITQRLLFDEMVFPVAIPSLLPRGRPLREPNPSAL